MPKSERKVPVHCYVKPVTKKFLRSLKMPNDGRAIDALVDKQLRRAT